MKTYEILQLLMGALMILAGLYQLLGTQVELPGSGGKGSAKPIPVRRAVLNSTGFILLGLAFVTIAINDKQGDDTVWGWLTVILAFAAAIMFLISVIDRRRSES